MTANERLFIALPLPPDVSQILAETQDRLIAHSCVRWITPASIHLTLQFLGGVSAGRIAPLCEALDSSCAGQPALRLRLQKLGVFPNFRRPNIVWAGVQGDLAELIALQQRIAETNHRVGFPLESRAFTPHLTMGRIRNHTAFHDIELLAKSIQAMQELRPTPWVSDRVELMRSELLPTGAKYTSIYSVSLQRA